MLGPGVRIVSPYFHHIGGQPTFKRLSVVPMIPTPRLLYVWATDISYIPMAKGFVYLVAIVDWFSRKVLAWRVSISMTGMPAWGAYLTDQQIWTLALFLKHMDKLPPNAQQLWAQIKN